MWCYMNYDSFYVDDESTHNSEIYAYRIISKSIIHSPVSRDEYSIVIINNKNVLDGHKNISLHAY